MVGIKCPLDSKEKLYVILNGECRKHLSCMMDCTFYKTRVGTLKAEWTDEMTEDLKSIHGLDIEKELITIMSMEIDKEIHKRYAW